MCQIALNIPEEVLYDTKMNQEQANQFARQAVALRYYTQSGVNIGYCSPAMRNKIFYFYLILHHLRILLFIHISPKFLKVIHLT